LGGRSIQTLSYEDMFLVLCLHASLHFWERLAWVCDVAEAIARWPGLDGASVARRARSSGAMRMLLTGLELSERLLGIRPSWQLAASPRERSATEQLVDEMVGNAIGSEDSVPTGRDQLRLRLRMCDHASDRGREVLRLLLT